MQLVRYTVCRRCWTYSTWCLTCMWCSLKFSNTEHTPKKFNWTLIIFTKRMYSPDFIFLLSTFPAEVPLFTLPAHRTAKLVLSGLPTIGLPLVLPPSQSSPIDFTTVEFKWCYCSSVLQFLVPSLRVLGLVSVGFRCFFLKIVPKVDNWKTLRPANYGMLKPAFSLLRVILHC